MAAEFHVDHQDVCHPDIVELGKLGQGGINAKPPHPSIPKPSFVCVPDSLVCTLEQRHSFVYAIMLPCFLCPPGGSHKGNISRGLKRSCQRRSPVLPIYDVRDCRVFDPRRQPLAGEVMMSQPIILPHDEVSWMYQNFRDQFDLRLLGGMSEDAIVRWWEAFRSDDISIWHHPCILQNSSLDKLGPLTRHLAKLSI